MSSNPMGPMGGDPGDENDSKWQQCEQDIESLEERVSALESKAGISSPADETEPAGGKTFPVKNAMTTGKMPFIGGSYK
jgi:hypothetical protein